MGVGLHVFFIIHNDILSLLSSNLLSLQHRGISGVDFDKQVNTTIDIELREFNYFSCYIVLHNYFTILYADDFSENENKQTYM